MLWYGLTFAAIRKSVELKVLREIKLKGFREMTACWSVWSMCRPMDRLWMFTSTSVKVHHCRASPSCASVKPCTCCHWRQMFSTESRSSALFFCYIIIIIGQFFLSEYCGFAWFVIVYLTVTAMRAWSIECTVILLTVQLDCLLITRMSG